MEMVGLNLRMRAGTHAVCIRMHAALLLQAQRMAAAERVMRGIFRGTVSRSFAPAAAQPPRSFQRGGGSVIGREPPQQRLHAQFAAARFSPGGLQGGGAVQGRHAASAAGIGTYLQQGGCFLHLFTYGPFGMLRSKCPGLWLC